MRVSVYYICIYVSCVICLLTGEEHDSDESPQPNKPNSSVTKRKHQINPDVTRSDEDDKRVCVCVCVRKLCFVADAFKCL